MESRRAGLSFEQRFEGLFWFQKVPGYRQTETETSEF